MFILMKSTSDENNIRATNIFKPLLIALQIHGLNFVDKTVSPYFALKISIQKLIACLFYVSLSISFYEGFRVSILTQGTWVDLLKCIGFYAVVAATYSIILVKRHQLHNFLFRLSSYSEYIVKKKPKTFTYLMFTTIILPYAVGLFNILYHMFMYSVPPGPLHVLTIVSWTCIIHPVNFFSMTLNLFICYTISCLFDQFKLEIQTRLDRRMDHRTWCRLVKIYIAQHKSLCKLVKEFGKIYDNIYLVYFAFSITILVFLIRALEMERQVREWNYRSMYSVFQTGILFISQVVAVSHINSLVMSSIHLMEPQLLTPGPYFVEETKLDTKLETILTNSELSLYIQQVSSNPASLTAGNFFIINKGTILSVAATVLTYILVLYGNDH